MKKPRPPRSIGLKRRIAGWTLLLLGLLVAGVWVASARWECWQNLPGRAAVRIGSGQVMVFRYPTPPSAARNFDLKLLSEGERGLKASASLASYSWFESTWDYFVIARADIASRRTTRWTVAVWPIPLALFAAGVPILRSGLLARRRALKGMCAKCGYSLAGLAADAPCPECGKGAKNA